MIISLISSVLASVDLKDIYLPKTVMEDLDIDSGDCANVRLLAKDLGMSLDYLDQLGSNYTDCCSYSGMSRVQCSASSNITLIDWSNLIPPLQGFVNSSILILLKQLETFNIQYNEIYGDIPNIPKSLVVFVILVLLCTLVAMRVF